MTKTTPKTTRKTTPTPTPTPTHAWNIDAGTYYDLAGAAQYVGRATVTMSYHVYSSHALAPTVRIGRAMLFSQRDLDRFIVECPPRGRTTAEAGNAPTTTLTPLAPDPNP